MNNRNYQFNDNKQKRMKTKIFNLALLICFITNGFAQDVTTTFSYPNWVESKQFDERAALYQVRLTTFFTYVTIQIEPTKNKKRQNYSITRKIICLRY